MSFSPNPRLVLVLASMALAVSSLAAQPARACSPPPCWPGHFVPGSGAVVPANVSALLWRPRDDRMGGSEAPAPTPRLVQLHADGSETDVPIAADPVSAQHTDVLIKPLAPLADGAQYRVEGGEICDMMSWDSGGTLLSETFSAGPAAGLPAKLGTLKVDVQQLHGLTVGTAAGMCDVTITARTAAVKVELDAGAAPWRDLLVYETIVDGERWYAAESILSSYAPGSSWVGRGRDLVYLVCGGQDAEYAFDGVSAGQHTVVMRATLPGTAVALETAPVSFEIACSDEPPVVDDPPPVVEDPPPATNPPPTNQPPAADPDDSAGVKRLPPRSGGCAVAAAGAVADSGGLLFAGALFAGVLALGVRRRRRR